MSYSDNKYITAKDLSFTGVLYDIKKSQKALQPVFEAFTNAIEAIKIKEKTDSNFKGEIEIKIYVTETTDQNHFEFSSLHITDNGIGFNEDEFVRFNTFKLASKGFKNLGSGRIQYVHYFDNTVVNSKFEQDGEIWEREFIVSKKQPFLDANAIVMHKHCKLSNDTQTGTTISFYALYENSNIYNGLNHLTLKESLLERYIHYFCYNRSNLPKIKISYYIQSSLRDESEINDSDIPTVSKTDHVTLSYSKVSNTDRSINVLDDKEHFTIDAFEISKDILKSNNLNLVSKGEIVEDSGIELESLAEGDHVQGNKYLFLVSSNYIDERDTNIRGILNIPKRESLSKTGSLFADQEIFLEDIQEAVNEKINVMYPAIKEVKKHHAQQFEQLKEMFLLDEEIARNIHISVNDSESKILVKFYEAEAKKSAEIDAEIKESFDKLNKLDTRADNYQDDLKNEINRLVKVIPLQNKVSLTHYVARRKLVLDLFDKILERELEVQKTNTRNFDEELIHNLLFQQGSSNPEDSDLWLINEDFIYFKGSSEKRLSKLTIDGAKIFKEEFNTEEENYLTSLGENRKIKRPDVLLFPEEGKCIILEFKSPEVNASEHLMQIDFYANLIRNYTFDEFQITTFYGYLIGENIEPRDVLGRVSRYEHSYQLGYLFRPSEKVNGFDGKTDGSIYTEVIKYTTLLERAKRRNKIFINKLH